jgi:hypothetical protein
LIHTIFELGLINAYLLLIVYHIITIFPFVYTKKNELEDSPKKKFKRDGFFRFIYKLSSIMSTLAIIVSFFLPIVFSFNFFFI